MRLLAAFALVLSASTVARAGEGWSYLDGGRTALLVRDGASVLRLACTPRGDLAVDLPGAGHAERVSVVKDQLVLSMEGSATQDGAFRSVVAFDSLTALVVGGGGDVRIDVAGEAPRSRVSLEGSDAALASVRKSCAALS